MPSRRRIAREWLSARIELLAREKELTRLRDRLVADAGGCRW